MSYTDSHAHLDDEKFREDQSETVERANTAGVDTILTIGLGTDPSAFQAAVTLAENHPGIWAAAGVHPHDAGGSSDELLSKVEESLSHTKAVAWGEIGLDYHYDNSPRDVQRAVFRQQLKLARAAKLPVVIHCRDAWEDCLTLLSEEWASSGLGGIFHCFTGDLSHARRGLDWGFLISFSGIVTFPKSDAMRDVARQVPVDSLLIETDCPYLAPKPHRGRRNEPAFVVEVAAELGRLHTMTGEEMGNRTTANFHRLFPGTAANSS